MKNNFFWLITLCVFLTTATVTGWSIPLRIAVVANALVVLVGVARQIIALKNTEEGQE